MSGNKLNKIQKAAVESIDGPILIFAGAGSGKTRVLTHKMYFLIKENHYKPENILAVTFTNKAAKEMKERVMGLLKTDDLPITIGTFHSVFARLFLAEKAAVRMQFVSGTHAISSVLFGILRPGDVMLSLTGQPYDTLEEVIGIRGGGKGSLKDFDIEYKQINICENFDSFEEKIVHSFEENSC